MAKRSLKASSAGIAKAKRAFERREWTQEYLASAVGLQTRQSIWKFFSGRPIERHLFIDICFQLDLDWQDIADLPNWDEPEADFIPQKDASAIVLGTEAPQTWQWLREALRDRIEQQCSTLQTVFSSEKPLLLEQVYTELSLLPSLECHRWIEAAKLQQLYHETSSDASSCFSPQASQSFSIPAQTGSNQEHQQAIQDLLNQSRHLLIYGKPGSGKTAMLQALALQHLTRQDEIAQVPLFLSVRHLCDQLSHLSRQGLETLLFQQCQETGITFSALQQILSEGKFLVLLDGLDELPQHTLDRLNIAVQTFAAEYPNTSIVMTCRLGVSDICCQGFKSVELADLGDRQIQTFVQKWFSVFGANDPNPNPQNPEQTSAQQFLEQLSQPQNHRLRDFAKTPLLLHVLCWIFREQQQFPQRRSRVYYTILELLLVRWDRLRNVDREFPSISLDFADYITLLSQIAGLRFEAEQYFFEKKDVLCVIFDYLMQLSQSSTCEELWLESEAILRLLTIKGILIERAYEVYSFSHLALQEYLTARRIFAQTHTKTSASSVETDSTHYPKLLPSLAQKLNRSRWKTQHSFYHLASHVFEPRWHEVIFLTIDLVPNSELLLELIKKQIDRAVLSDINLRSLVQWLDRKASEVSYPSDSVSALRAFYLGCQQNLGLDLATKLDPHLVAQPPSELALEAKLTQMSQAVTDFLTVPTPDQVKQITSSLTPEDVLILDPSVSTTFKQAREIVQTASPNQLETWCQTEGILWAQQLKKRLMQSYDLGYDWEFTLAQHQQIASYYWANVFLVDCLHHATSQGTQFRKTIEAAILSPRELRPTDPKAITSVIKERAARKTKLLA